MITLKQAISLLDLSDQDMIYLAKERFDHNAPFMTVKAIREKYDMKRTMVLKIYPYHWKYDPANDYELIIREGGRKNA